VYGSGHILNGLELLSCITCIYLAHTSPAPSIVLSDRSEPNTTRKHPLMPSNAVSHRYTPRLESTPHIHELSWQNAREEPHHEQESCIYGHTAAKADKYAQLESLYW
jgi:hypothetical protein